jgi:hypothetical protein
MSQTSKYTPGPWFAVVNGFGSNCVGAFGFDTDDGTQLLANVREYGAIDFSTAKANARLIAASPDLLEALEEICREYDPSDGSANGQMMFDIARAAIAKAKGTA